MTAEPLTRMTRYATTREDKEAKPATVRYELSILCCMFRVAVKEEMLEHVPISGRSRSRTRAPAFSPTPSLPPSSQVYPPTRSLS